MATNGGFAHGRGPLIHIFRAVFLIILHGSCSHAAEFESVQDYVDFIHGEASFLGKTDKLLKLNNTVHLCAEHMHDIKFFSTDAEKALGKRLSAHGHGRHGDDERFIPLRFVLRVAAGQACHDAAWIRGIFSQFSDKTQANDDALSLQDLAENMLSVIFELSGMGIPSQDMLTITRPPIPRTQLSGWGAAHFACAMHEGGSLADYRGNLRSEDMLQALSDLHYNGFDLATPVRNVKRERYQEYGNTYQEYAGLLPGMSPVHVCASEGFDQGIKMLADFGYKLHEEGSMGAEPFRCALVRDKV
jgi:hypothetical protein